MDTAWNTMEREKAFDKNSAEQPIWTAWQDHLC